MLHTEAQGVPTESKKNCFKNDQKLKTPGRPARWNMGFLNDHTTHDVPGSVLLLTKHEEPSDSDKLQDHDPETLSTPFDQGTEEVGKKKTPDGRIILEPQPEESSNDPLNWPIWRKDAALLSIGLFSMIGGGMTPVLAAGFTNVAATYHIKIAKVSLTTGLYMMGLGLGSVISSPAAVLYGKRPVYLLGAIVLFCSSVWCATARSFPSLILARILQGVSISPIECLPSASITEIFFLHERAYRIGVYSLLLLGGKNLVPLVSAVIIESLGWRWVFWITAMIGAFCIVVIFFFVPETFWDRDSSLKPICDALSRLDNSQNSHEKRSNLVDDSLQTQNEIKKTEAPTFETTHISSSDSHRTFKEGQSKIPVHQNYRRHNLVNSDRHCEQIVEGHNINEIESALNGNEITSWDDKKINRNFVSTYTAKRRSYSKVSFIKQLKPWSGRLASESWLEVALRPFLLFTYPAVLWSSVVYACSIGWLIVISESVTLLFRSRSTYGFSALTAGLIYLSPFVGGIMGTAIAGKASDFIVRKMSKRNHNYYEPEFRLVMAIPVAITTVIGLIGLGWSVQVVDMWIIPTVFFGIVSFGCSLGATTAITFCVDSYRMYASEALVTMNFSKNIMHGLVFSLFVNQWIEKDGPKWVFIWLGVIQLIVMAFTIPMYIFGKRARIWTLRRNPMIKPC